MVLTSGWWFGTFGLFFHILGTMIPFDELICFSEGVGTQPPSRLIDVKKPVVFFFPFGKSISLVQTGLPSESPAE
jgi:hypothetical protein